MNKENNKLVEYMLTYIPNKKDIDNFNKSIKLQEKEFKETTKKLYNKVNSYYRIY